LHLRTNKRGLKCEHPSTAFAAVLGISLDCADDERVKVTVVRSSRTVGKALYYYFFEV